MITLEQLYSFKPCPEYTEEDVARHFKSVCGRRKKMKLADALKLDIPDDHILWLILRPEFIAERKLHEIAIWCWEEIAKPIWEKEYPNDKRPHEAIRIKKLWIEGKATDEELAEARAASRAASWEASRAATWEAANKKILDHVREATK